MKNKTKSTAIPGGKSADASAALAPRDGLLDKLAAKVRTQAAQLEELQGDVEERKAYARLCEQFVVSLEPSQPLPLAKEDLAALRARQTRAHAQDGAFVNRSSRHTLTTIARQYESACKRINEQGEKIAELEAELARDKDAREVSAQRVTALRKKLGEAQSRILQLRRGSPASVGVTSEELETLQSRVGDLEQDKLKLSASLEKESRATEEQRVYIDVLQSALKARAEELGLDPDQVANTERAKFDILAAKTAIARLERNESDLRETVAVIKERLRLEGLRLRQSRKRLSLYEPVDGPGSGDGCGEDDDLVADTIHETEAKGGDRSRSVGQSPGTGRNVQHLQATNRKLQQENEALLDFVRETVEPLKAEKAEIEETLEATAASLDAVRKDQDTLRSQLSATEQACEEANLKAAQANVEWNAAREACVVTEEERDLARAELEETRAELATARSAAQTQRQALDSLNAELESAQARCAEVDEIAQQLTDTQNTLRCERRELVAAEEKRSALEAKNSELEVVRMDLQDRVAKLQTERERLEGVVETLETQLAAAKQESSTHKKACEDLREEQQVLSAETKELRLVKRKMQRIEKAIATLWHEGTSPEIGLANLQDIMQRVSSGAMGGADEEASSTVTNVLESIMPHLNSLLFSAQSLVARGHADVARLQKEVSGQDERFQVEKRLLHDEIHALRQKFNQVERVQEETRKLSASNLETGGSPSELARLRQRHADLETKCAALELRVHEAEHGAGNANAGFEDALHENAMHETASGSVRNMRSRLEQASEQAEQVLTLKEDLEKAALLLREQEEVTQQIEAQLMDAETSLKEGQQDADMARRLVTATLKGIFVRYRAGHEAVLDFFADGGPVEHDQGDRSLEDAVTPLCELIEAVLEFDTTVRTRVRTGPSSSRPRSSHSVTVRQRERARVARIEALNDSLARAQQAVDDTRAQLQTELQREGRRGIPQELRSHSFATASSIGIRSNRFEDEDLDAGSRTFTSEARGPRVGVSNIYDREHEFDEVTGDDDDTDEIIVRRAQSPSRVRVARDGSVQIDTMTRSRVKRRPSSDLESSLRDAAHKVDQVDRIRKNSARQDTPQSQRYKHQLKVAQDRFRRLSSLAR
ncbi:Laminin-like protein epi-1 [Hondaea fermentalgiana]|uniref:Laminin-like protein epi-1 n=1 Tax=Hondaea fermentalgiana TaxID=2315210 RepID=A0A2R5G9Z9_9STRA|nr:Laminin-like protein epi-1 [Hondaea fermentalgiana]|eukprot:GBG25373.1 Laminin-like protein epi-1 [Hondaea fermentalgiana]